MQRIVLYGVLCENEDHKKQIVDGFKEMGFGDVKVVGSFMTLAGKGGKGGRSDVVVDVEDKVVSRLAVHPLHLSGGFSWADDYVNNNREIIPGEAMVRYFKEENDKEEIDGVPKEVFIQYEEVRQSGKCNMFAMGCVESIAVKMKLYDLLHFVVDNGSKGYAKLLGSYDKAKEKQWI